MEVKIANVNRHSSTTWDTSSSYHYNNAMNIDIEYRCKNCHCWNLCTIFIPTRYVCDFKNCIVDWDVEIPNDQKNLNCGHTIFYNFFNDLPIVWGYEEYDGMSLEEGRMYYEVLRIEKKFDEVCNRLNRIEEVLNIK